MRAAGGWLALVLPLLFACGGETGGDGVAPDDEPGSRGAARAGRGFPDANLVVISLDTLRWDGLGVGGGPEGISPELDAFAAEAVTFEHARAVAPHTAPSHMSLFTSLYPSMHGVQNVAHGKDPRNKGTPLEDRVVPIIYPLPPEIPTLAEVLQAEGFTTLGLTDGGNINPGHGFARGFEVYSSDLSGVEAQVEDAEAWLATRRAPAPSPDGEPVTGRRLADFAFDDRPAGRHFLFWHTYQIHAPYVPPESYIETWAPADYDGLLRPVIAGLEGLTMAERWGRMKTEFWADRDSFGDDEARFLKGLYHGGIAYTDDVLPRLFAALEAAGAYDDSIIVLTSDHGEEFAEHGAWQHEQVYEECLRVPLMIRLPGGAHGGRRVATPVSLMDVMPTVLDLLEVDPADHPGLRMFGRSLAPALVGGVEPEARPLVSELRADHPGNPIHEWRVAVHFQGFKYIRDRVRGQRVNGEIVWEQELYDLTKDPGETTDVSEALPERTRFFREWHDDTWDTLVKAATGEIDFDPGSLDPETLEQLIRLGYIDAAAVPAAARDPAAGAVAAPGGDTDEGR